MDRCYRRFSPRMRLVLTITAILIVLLAVILVPVLYFMGSRENRGASVGSEAVWRPDCPSSTMAEKERFDCHPEPGVTEKKCVARGCCWRPLMKLRPSEKAIPPCVYPRNYGYVLGEDERLLPDGWEMLLHRLPAPPRYGHEISKVGVLVQMQTTTRLRIKFYDPSERRFEVPEPTIPVEKTLGPGREEGGKRLYAVSFNRTSVPFGLRVRRVDNDVTVFDTRWGGMTFDDQFIQISSLLPSHHVYGLGEHTHRQLHHDLHWRTWSMVSRDARPEEGKNGNGVHPIYFCVEENGNTHAVLLLYSNPLEVQFQPTPAVTFRAIGGVLDFYLFFGPKPEDVLRQLMQAIGRPIMPPYWALGFQISRSGYRDLSHVNQTIEHMRNASIPFDIVAMDTDYLWDEHDFSPHPIKFGQMKAFASVLRRRRQHLILTLRPSVMIPKTDKFYDPYEEGMRARIFITDIYGQQPIQGKAKNGVVVYPDFGTTASSEWLRRRLTWLFENAPYDGLWLNENEPTSLINGSINGCYEDSYNYPPYLPNIQGNLLYDGTLCMDATHTWGQETYKHIDIHNLYGHYMLKVTARVLTSIIKKRSLVLSRSTFVGSGKYGGHWLSKYAETWEQLRWSLPALLEFNLFGIPYVGADICGYEGEADPDLCVRWVQLGAFYPMARIHHRQGKQESLWNQDIVIHVLKKALATRYTLLPYLYTLFYAAHTVGAPVARPLFYEFFTDNNTYKIDTQFMWGPALLISPVLVKDVRTIEAYFPAGRWYDYYTGQQRTSTGKWERVDALIEKISLHWRGGHIVPTQATPANAAEGRERPMQLIVALDEAQTARGSLYWDDGETRDAHKLKEYVLTSFWVINDTLIVIGQKGRPSLKTNFSLVKFDSINVLGLPKAPARVTIGDQQLLERRQVEWVAHSMILKIWNIAIPITESLEIQWHWR